ncbi:MAG TPA: hypothetical protein VGH43_17915 [Jatrophihabitans sp.]
MLARIRVRRPQGVALALEQGREMPATATWQRPPTRWARVLIGASVAVLPRSARPRYEDEFIADLYGMSRTEQAGYASHVLARCMPLRLAVRSATGRTSDLGGIDMTSRQHRPLRCRLNIRHDWHNESTEDGGRYQQCRRCGKDETGSVQTSSDAQVAAHAANMLNSGGAGGGGL